jgi:hypothetical protein
MACRIINPSFNPPSTSKWSFHTSTFYTLRTVFICRWMNWPDDRPVRVCRESSRCSTTKKWCPKTVLIMLVGQTIWTCNYESNRACHAIRTMVTSIALNPNPTQQPVWHRYIRAVKLKCLHIVQSMSYVLTQDKNFKGLCQAMIARLSELVSACYGSVCGCPKKGSCYPLTALYTTRILGGACVEFLLYSAARHGAVQTSAVQSVVQTK